MVYQHISDKSEQKSENAKFDVGRVVGTAPNDSSDPQKNVPHLVKVNVRHQDAPKWMQVAVPTHGDINLPGEGQRVLVGYKKGDRPFVLPVYAGDEEVREYKVGTRIIGHEPTDSKLEINPNGEYRHVDAYDNRIVTNENGSTIVEDNSGSILEMRNDDSLRLESQSGVTVEMNPNGEVKLTDNWGNDYTTDHNGDTTISHESGSTVELKSNGDVVINASGDVKLDGGSTKVARKGDAVQVNDPDSGTITGEITEGSSTVKSA